jgi:hypothetical protein
MMLRLSCRLPATDTVHWRLALTRINIRFSSIPTHRFHFKEHNQHGRRPTTRRTPLRWPQTRRPPPITGHGTYAGDWQLPGQLYGHFVSSDHAHAENLPVYLDAKVQAHLASIAAKKGVPMSDLANDLLKREIAILEVTK